MYKLFLLIFCVLSLSVTSQQFFSDVSITSGGRYNNMHSYEEFYDFEDNQTSYHGIMYTHNKNWKAFGKINFSIFKTHIKKDSTLFLSIRTGVFYHQITRRFNFDYLTASRDTTFDYIITGFNENLFYEVKTHNLGIDLGVVFSKTWKNYFIYEYGLTYKADYAFVDHLEYYRLPPNEKWKQLEYPQKHQFRNKLNHEVYLNQNFLFNIKNFLTLGLSLEVPTHIVGSLIAFRMRYPIAASSNNYWNKNSFFGVLLRYNFKPR